MTVSLQTAPIGPTDLATLGLQPDVAFYTVDAPLLWGRVIARPSRCWSAAKHGHCPQSADDVELGLGLTLAGPAVCRQECAGSILCCQKL